MASDETVWLDVHFRWWARPFVCWLMWKIIGYVPPWALRIRRVSPPRE
ncbi:MAG TPA: hypothetical protein VM098_02210 [Phycisphaerae bacterium]|nr:hypothetical protein [Phycisphaerae bacterium]